MTPDPLEQAADAVELITLTKSDFEFFEATIIAVQQDVTALAALLGVRPEDGSNPHEVMVTMLLPKVASLMLTQRQVDEASAQISKAASRFGNKKQKFGNVQGIKVGERIPGLFDG